MTLNYTVYDAETTVNCPEDVSKNKALPSWPGNKIVMDAYKTQDMSEPQVGSTYPGLYNPLLVGHNLIFDLQYIRKHYPIHYESIVKNTKIWDTAIADYCMSAQQRLFPSLNDLALQHGGTLKDDKIKAHWDAGGKTEDIEVPVLKEYLENDVINTEKAFLSQLKWLKATNNKQLIRLILSQGNTALALAEIAHNGMCINREELLRQLSKNENAMTGFKEYLSVAIHGVGVPSDEVNPESNKQLSLLIFGGTLKTKEKVPDGFYKNGKPKMKTVTVDKTVPPRCYDVMQYAVTSNTGYSVGDDVLEKLLTDKNVPSNTKAVAAAIQQLRKLSKENNTYIEPILKGSFSDDPITTAYSKEYLHGNINNTSTATGRFSSNNPNLQNLTSKEKSELKKGFISRFEGGMIIEADYKQLEVVALAYLADCKQLKEDINNGVDIHTALFEQMYGRTPSDEERKLFKRRSFALIYGAGAASIAEQAKCTIEEARAFMKTFFTRYPEVKQFRERIKQQVAATAHDAGFDEETKMPIKKGCYTLPTGRILSFKQYYNKWTKGVEFSPTQMANYPVQSFATADIVQTVLGVLYRRLWNSDLRHKCLLINTVHDSIIFDVHPDCVDEAANFIREVMSDVSGILSNMYEIKDFDVNITVNITKGPNWYEQEKV